MNRREQLFAICIALVVALVFGCHPTGRSTTPQSDSITDWSADTTDTVNITIVMKMDSVTASTPQDIYLTGYFFRNWQIVDSIRTDGRREMTMKGHIPYQEILHLVFEKRGPRDAELILTPGDSISIEIPNDKDTELTTLIDIPQLEVQTIYNDYCRKNRQLRAHMSNIVAQMVHTTDDEAQRKTMLKERFLKDSLELKALYTSLVNSPYPVLADYSLIFMDIDYDELKVHKDRLLAKFPGYWPILDDYNMVEKMPVTAESKRISQKIASIKRDRVFGIFSDNVDKSIPQVGEKMNLRLYDEDGDAGWLSDFEGKIVLVDFWASWCGPCLKDMPSIMAAKSAYTEDFEVCAITIDKLRASWRQRIKSDSLNNMNHYTAIDYETGKLYPEFERLGFTAIPKNYLLDRNGTILAIDIHGDDLKTELSRLCKKY